MRSLSRWMCVAALLTVGLGWLTTTARAQDNNPLVGKPAPDIKGEFAVNGKPVSLSDLKGKVVLIDFWAVWCGPCIATFPHLRDWHKEFDDEGLVILGVTSYWKSFDFDDEAGKLKRAAAGLSEEQEHDMLKRFAKHHKLDHLLLAVSQDGWKQIGKDYNVQGIPTAVLVDRLGVVRVIRVGSGEANANALEKGIRDLLKEQ